MIFNKFLINKNNLRVNIAIFLWLILSCLIVNKFISNKYSYEISIPRDHFKGFQDQEIVRRFKDHKIVKKVIRNYANTVSIENIRYVPFEDSEYLSNLKINNTDLDVLVSYSNSSKYLARSLLKDHVDKVVLSTKNNVINNKDQNLDKVKKNKILVNKEIEKTKKQLIQTEIKSINKEKKGLITKLQTYSATYAKKHPKIQSLYSEISGLYKLSQEETPSLEKLLIMPVVKGSSSVIALKDSEFYEKRLLELESKIYAYDKDILYYKTLTKGSVNDYTPYLLGENWYSNSITKSVIYAFACYLLLLFIGFLIDVTKNTFSTANELRNKFDDIKIYSFPKLRINKSFDKEESKPLFLTDSSHADTSLAKREESGLPVSTINLKETDDQKQIQLLASELVIEAKKEGKNIFMFSSSSKKCGSSVVASNLSIAMSKVSNKVLLVDANFLSSSLHNRFNVSENTAGFSDYIAKKKAIKNYVQETPISGLYLMTAGQSSHSAYKSYTGNRINRVLKTVSKQYNFVIVDLGSIMDNTSASFISTAVGAVYLVVKANSTTSEIVKNAIDKLHNIKVKTEGIILNKANTK